MWTPEEKKEVRKKTLKPLAWIGIVSIVMLFAGLTSGYLVVQGDAFWVKADLPQMFLYSTAIIVISSITMIAAVHFAKRDNKSSTVLAVALTFILGLAFCGTQYLAWKELIAKGQFFVGKISDLKGEYGQDYIITAHGERLQYVEGKFYMPNDRDLLKPLNEDIDKAFNASGSFLYVLSGVHLTHILFAMLVLLVTLAKASMGKYAEGNTVGIEAMGIFWHFLGGLWIYLYLFLLFIR